MAVTTLFEVAGRGGKKPEEEGGRGKKYKGEKKNSGQRERNPFDIGERGEHRRHCRAGVAHGERKQTSCSSSSRRAGVGAGGRGLRCYPLKSRL